MPIETPFHPRTASLCTSYRWKEWAGYHAVASYETSHDAEYLALRNSAGLLDVSPLQKYDIRGPEAAEFLSYVWTKDLRSLELGQVAYGCFCDEAGKVLDDGTITRFSEQCYRMTSTHPAFQWLHQHARSFDVQVADVSQQIAALALQGPASRAIMTLLCGEQLSLLPYFRAAETTLANREVQVTRTGYTGDLGYELWMPKEHALDVWDALVETGQNYAMRPVGLDALDVTRIEAGHLLAGVDFFDSRFAKTEIQKSSPFELGLDWTVDLNRDRFIGREALQLETRTGTSQRLVGLTLDWDQIESLFEAQGLPPTLCNRAWREGVPVYEGTRQVGQATSGTWSPILKQNIALATVEDQFAKLGTELNIEFTVQYSREKVRATVVQRPFYDPPRKRSLTESPAFLGPHSNTGSHAL